MPGKMSSGHFFNETGPKAPVCWQREALTERGPPLERCDTVAFIPPKDVMLANARHLRKAMTPWERKLWYCFLRTYPIKFYKQRILGPYIVDFYCPSARLVLELDGSQHFMPDGQNSDGGRDTSLQANGYAILRIPNIDIDRRYQAVCEFIHRETQSRISQ